MKEEPLLNIKETAAFLRVSTRTVFRLIQDGRLQASMVGGRWRIRPDDIRAYLEETSNRKKRETEKP